MECAVCKAVTHLGVDAGKAASLHAAALVAGIHISGDAAVE